MHFVDDVEQKEILDNLESLLPRRRCFFLTEFDAVKRLQNVTRRICTKTHRNKNQAERQDVILSITCQPEYLRILLLICEKCDDSETLAYALTILSGCVDPKAPWRGKNVDQILALKGIHSIAIAFASVLKSNVSLNQGILSGVCLLSALATRAPVLVSESFLRQDVIPHIVPRLKVCVLQFSGIQPILQLIRSIIQDNQIRDIFVKDGMIEQLISTLKVLLSKKNSNIKLRLCLEILLIILKQDRYIDMMSQSTSIQALVCLFQNVDKLNRKVRNIRLCMLTLNIFKILTSTEKGKLMFDKTGGVNCLKEFCFNLPWIDGKWEKMISKCHLVLNRFCPTQDLPVSCKESAFHYDLGIEIDAVSNSTFSRESSPFESESENGATGESTSDYYDDDDDDEEDEEAYEEEEDVFVYESKMTDRQMKQMVPLTATPSLENNFIRYSDEELQPFAKFFPEFQSRTVDNSASNSLNAFDSKVSEVNGYLVTYIDEVLPNLIETSSPDQAEPLLIKDISLHRKKLLENMVEMFHSESNVIHQSHRVLYDLDALMLGNSEMDHGLHEDHDHDLRFESRFEGGNLRKALKVDDYAYELVLNPDVNTSGHCKYFYFQVSQMTGNHSYKFSIINFESSNSQYVFGMKPLLFSTREASYGRPFWYRIGSEVSYFRNNFRNPSRSNNYLSVTFTIQFPHSDDVCYLSYHYPYTYTNLMNHVKYLGCHLDTGVYFVVAHLASTELNHKVPLITITAKNTPNNEDGLNQKKIVFLTARVHPGETNSSWIMKGLLDFLVSDDPKAALLRSKFLFKIIPMLNVDGVVNGSHRCGLSGEDLNRKWKEPEMQLHPEIFYTKSLLAYVTQILGKQIYFFCDFHGHSRKKNVFLYGCDPTQSWLKSDHQTSLQGQTKTGSAETFQKICEAEIPGFSLNSCKNVIEKNRESTARIVLWREFGVKHSYTLESTFCGFRQGAKGTHISTQRLIDIGKHFALALLKLQQAEDR